jgi:hypothetical protein
VTDDGMPPPHFMVDIDGFTKEMEGEDAPGVVIRSAIHLEHQLLGVIDNGLANSSALKDVDLDFMGRLCLAEALGLPKHLVATVAAIGRIRNKFAHRLDYKFDREAIGALEATASEVLKVAYAQALHETAARQKVTGRASFDLDDPLDRFKMLAFVTLVGIILWRVNTKPS